MDVLKIENARLVFRNLSGKPDKFNSQGGKRNFAVVIDDPDVADNLIKEGWNYLKNNRIILNIIIFLSGINFISFDA